jgi:hypothetical protein
MRRAILLVAAVNGVLASPVPEEMLGVSADPPSGIGTGVTIAIAPPGKLPKGCYTSWSGANFGIAAVPIGKGRAVDMEDGAPVGSATAPEVPNFSLSDTSLPAGDAFPARADGLLDLDLDFPEPTAAPTVLKFLESHKAQAAGAPAAAPEEDVTVTRKTTRTHTRTVTLNSASPIAPPAASPTGVDLTGLKTIKAAQLYQIGDGQVQAPPKLTEIALKPKATPSSGGAAPTPFAPLPSSAPRISQIFDGQIQAPTVGVGAGPPKPAASPAGEMSGHGGHMKRQQTTAGAGVMGGYGCRNKDGSTLELSLKNGILKDKRQWTGYIADNRQFQ